MTPLTFKQICDNGWLYTDIQAEEMLKSKDFTLIHDFGEDKKFLIYKPTSWLEAGLVLAPYIPVMITSELTRISPEMASRYIQTTVNSNLFTSINISTDLQFTPPTMTNERV